MTELHVSNYLLVFINLVPIIALWVRMESRLSKLEGRFTQQDVNGRPYNGPERRKH